MKIAFVLGLGAFNLAAILLVFLNRSSEKILTSYLTITVGAIAAIALSIAAFAEQATINQRFPIAFFIDPADRRLIEISSRVDIFRPSEAESHAADLSSPSDQFGVKAYHGALQRVLVEWLIRTYWHTWRIESIHYETPGDWELRTGPIEGADDNATVLSMADITRHFSSSPPLPYADKINKIALPPGLFGRRAELEVRDLYNDAKFGETGEMSIRNDFCELRFTTRSLGYRSGLGEYGTLAGVTEDEERQFGHLLYEVIARVTFRSCLGGHPEMPKYRRWAMSLIDMMQDTFDEQRILVRSRDAANHPKFLPSKNRPHFPPVSKLERVKPNPKP